MSTFETTFVPEEHGFPWANQFKGQDIVASWLDQSLLSVEAGSSMLGLVHGGPPQQLTAEMLDITDDEVVEELGVLVEGVGLSAGMCLSALDRQGAGKSPWKRRPGRRSGNFASLAARQFEVVGDWRWLVETTFDMSRPDVAHIWNETSSLGELSTDEWWPRIRRRLQRGVPVPLLLYRSRWNPFGNDVVVAYAGDESGDGAEARIDVYDPNHPDDRTHLTIDFRRMNSFRLGPKSVYDVADRKVRGFKRLRGRAPVVGDEAAGKRDLAAQLAATA